MATELAQAYVQIIPSAKGIKGSISEQLGGEATSAGESAGTSIGTGLVSKLKGVIAAAGIGKLISDTMSQGADYEQNIGGMETLYKDASDKMVEYANNAYKTAQLSANDYMQTATSFSASLLSSLGGDTQKAADAANQAIIDMSDNANKMGTDMSSIQDAYRGFAKQNYTMLDNLSLGYGGTKTEMERLLADAEELSGVHYDISNLNDVYSAIHVIQQEMGITGTSAKEGAATISGSVAMVKSSWANLQSQITTGGDVSGAMESLGESLAAAASNILPAIGNILAGIPQLLASAITSMMEYAPQMMESGAEMLRKIAEGFMQAMPQLISAIGEAAPQILSSAQQLVQKFSEGVQTNLPTILQNGVQVVTSLVQGIAQDLPQMLTSAAQVIAQFIQAIGVALPQILQAGVQIVISLVQGILQDLPAVIESAGEVINSLLDAFLTDLPQIIDMGLQLLEALIQGIVDNLPEIVTATAEVVAKLIATIAEHLPEIIESGIEIIAKLIEGLIKAIPDIIAAIPQIIDSIVNAFGDFDWGSIGKSIIDGIKNGISAAAGAIADAAKQAAKSALNAAKSFLGIGSPSKVFRKEVGQWIPPGAALGVEDKAYLFQDAVQEMADEAVIDTGITEDVALNLRQNGGTLTGSSAIGGTSSSTFNITINQQPGQSSEELVDVIERRIAEKSKRRGAVFA